MGDGREATRCNVKRPWREQRSTLHVLYPVVPYALRLELERVEVRGRDVVRVRVRAAVAAAADVAADQADPEVRRALAVGAVRALVGGDRRGKGDLARRTGGRGV